ncbi:beta-N-acetylhexosaminidase [Streptomyces sp. NBC_00370]|uniref:beta-N-acetylhexosaminidase n=1 Tax=Streptomyces sp. NBC_00370 TaxID=2975728 RepID=UPI002E275E63
MWHPRNALRLTAAGLAATVGALSLAACQDQSSDSGGAATPAPTSSSAASAASSAAAASASSAAPEPSPTRSYPLSSAPRTVPAVRSHQAAHGPGWRPSANSGVVVARGSAGSGLADEAKLLAQELKIGYRGAVAARAGDVELALKPGGGAESYTLTAANNRVLITGPAQAGVFYATRTLKQAVRADGAMPEGVVRDSPDRPQRGLNLDIARKFYSEGWIEDRLREMADLKLNQLGLHFSDDQGFRIESATHPDIVSAEHFTKAQIRQILAVAARLHITVVPEIDSPGHLGAVLAPNPTLKLRNTAGVVTKGAIDISKPASARLIDDLDREFAALFTGAYWHLGADEYQALTVRDPAASFPQLATAARQKYGSGASVTDLTAGWTNDRAGVVTKLGKQPKVWNDGVFAGGTVHADKNLQIEYWTGKEIGARQPVSYLQEGRPMVNLNDEYMYYVLGQPNDFTYPTGQRIYEQWTPLVLRGTTAVPARYSKQILGGRFAVWGDFPNAQTQDQVAAGIKMPLAATAQKLWNPGKPALSWTGFTALATKLDVG